MIMKAVMASACLAVGSSRSGAYHRMRGAITARRRPINTRHDTCARARALGSSLADCATLANSLLIQNLAPLLFGCRAHSRTRFGDRRKLAQPFVRPAGVNDCARA